MTPSAARDALLGRFEPGERIAVWAPNIPEWEIVEFGAALAGMILVTVNPAYKPGRAEVCAGAVGRVGHLPACPSSAAIRWRSRCSVRAELPLLREAIAFTEFEAFLSSGSRSERLPAVAPDDPVQIQYTSGTTGFPKGALLHHRGLTNNARMTLAHRRPRRRARSTSTRSRCFTPRAAASARSAASRTSSRTFRCSRSSPA